MKFVILIQYHTQLANTSFGGLLDLTAEVAI